MKISLGADSYLEPDEEPRNSPYHMRIVKAEAIPNTRSGNNVTLECGHRVQTFGDFRRFRGIVMCTQCRDLLAPSRILSIQCPTCGRTSYNPHDVENRYCGYCHVFL